MSIQPGDRAIAPGPLALVQGFVNSINVEFGPDTLETCAGLASWLQRWGLGDPQIQPDERDRLDAVALREALRALLYEHNGGPSDPGARATIEQIAATAPLVLSFSSPEGDLRLVGQKPGVRGAFALILAAVANATTDGSWVRLKACHEHRCSWAFYDRSRNRGSRWCSMQVCGTRSKMRTYREGARTSA